MSGGRRRKPQAVTLENRCCEAAHDHPSPSSSARRVRLGRSETSLARSGTPGADPAQLMLTPYAAAAPSPAAQALTRALADFGGGAPGLAGVTPQGAAAAGLRDDGATSMLTPYSRGMRLQLASLT